MILVFTKDHPGLDPVHAAILAFGEAAVEQETVVVVHDSDIEESRPVQAE